MKNRLSVKLTSIIIACVVVIMAILNIVIFVNDFYALAAQSLPSFWVAWAFTFPANLALIIFVLIYNLKAKEDIVFRFPLFYLLFIYEIASLIAGCCFLFIPNLDIALVASIESVIALLFILGFLYALGASSYVAHGQEKTKKKVTYIKDLEATLNVAANSISDVTVKKNVQSLAEKIRFSDPMSDDSLADLELEISNNVDKIIALANSNNVEGINDLIKTTSQTLELRNAKCKAHK